MKKVIKKLKALGIELEVVGGDIVIKGCDSKETSIRKVSKAQRILRELESRGLLRELHGNAKMSNLEAIEVILQIDAGTKPAKIARNFGQRPSTIRQIQIRESWTWLSNAVEEIEGRKLNYFKYN